MSVDELSTRAFEILRESNTFLENQHFVYVSGDHGSGWINKDALLPCIEKISELASLMAKSLSNSGAVKHIDILCGPAIGGLVMAQWLGHHLSLPAVFAEHDKGAVPVLNGAMRSKFVLGRGFAKLVRDKNVLIVDDIINSGHSIRQTAAAVREAGGSVVGAISYCTRGNASETDLDVPWFLYLCEYKIPYWSAQSCQLCAMAVPVNVDYAHGKDFVDSLANHSRL